jgi:hypothetical protein
MLVPRIFADMMWFFRPASLEVDGPTSAVCITCPPDENPDDLREAALHLANSLDGLATRDWVERVGDAIKRGNAEFADLLRRRASLSLTAVDENSIDSIMETIRARLKFLESLYRRNTKH